MGSITEFLTARLDEQEVAECGCEKNQFGDIRCHNCGECVNVKCWKCGTPRGSGPCPTPRSARVLADIAAKRAILEHHRPATAEDTHEIGAHPINDGRCWSCVASHDERGYCEQLEYPCPTMLALLQPYTDHPDLDEAWRTA